MNAQNRVPAGRLGVLLAVLFAPALLTFAGGCSGPAASPAEVAEAPAETEASQDLNLDVSPPKPTNDAPSFEEDSQYFIDHDRFLAVDDPKLVSADDAQFLDEDDQVLGFVIDGEARAYSIRALAYHHVVNDTIADTPVAVTY